MRGFYGTSVEATAGVRHFMVVAVALLLLAGCRGEPVPRDYQNHPSTMTNPPDSSSETPSSHNLGNASPQPTTGVEGTAGPYQPVTPPVDGPVTTTISDTPPATAPPPGDE